MRQHSTVTRVGMLAHAAFITFLTLAIVSSTTGSCLSYGHSCWGAHGKRSGTEPQRQEVYLTDERVLPLTLGDRLLLPKLLNRRSQLAARLRDKVLIKDQARNLNDETEATRLKHGMPPDIMSDIDDPSYYSRRGLVPQRAEVPDNLLTPQDKQQAESEDESMDSRFYQLLLKNLGKSMKK
ncbi:uncharacterized protein LOC106657737 [Trichogramma pretiosum]|uniref:uncharacterized protein LOC106657737 n=1 Tax=Trichogramma pretiosum TaxID=7493 RepID=UPI0006C9C309|nr:uncharacterized protein LOC106657737 [Trichogramma pretiosum]